MKVKVSKACLRTDHSGGVIQNSLTGEKVSVTDDVIAILNRFQDWNDPVAGDDPLQDTFNEMLSKSLLINQEVRLPADFEELAKPETTMFEAPWRAIEQVQPGEIAFLGAPLDIGTSAYPGARFGPSSIRSASIERYQCKFDLVSGNMTGWNVPSLGGGVLAGARFCDVGDLPYAPGEPADHYYQRLRTVVQKIYAAKAFPVVLGGDHSITYSTVPDTPVDLIHLDAHCDLAERVAGHCHHHGNVMRRLLDEKRVSQVHHFGLRDTAGWDTLDAGTCAKSIGDMEQPNWDADIIGKRVFVSLDVDVLDPSVLPATGTPVVGGLSLRQLCQVLARIVQNTKPVGLDVVELCPIRDESGNSERVVIEALLCFLAVLHASQA